MNPIASRQAYRESLERDHAELAAQLAETFTMAELVDLAQRLPADMRAANAIYPTPQGWANFAAWVKRAQNEEYGSVTARHSRMAVYVAAASQHAASKVLEEVLELRKQEKAKLDALKLLLDTAGTRAPSLAEAIKKGSAA